MGAQLGGGGNDDEFAEAHEINITPFIDVMLVLLIIFMVAAPLSTVDVAVDLPASNTQPQPRPNEPVFLTVKSDLTLAMGNDPLAREALKSALDNKTNSNTEERVFLRADKAVPYGDLMEVMNLLRNAGYLKIALVGLEALPDSSSGTGQPSPSMTPPSAVGPTAPVSQPR